MSDKPKQPRRTRSGGGILGWLKRNYPYFIAFLLPVVLICIAYAIFGLYPFGDKKSILCLDLNGQYVYYFEALRDAFYGEESIFYNWSRNLSGGYMGVIGYYLASPYTLIVMLLPRDMILISLLIMILCKLGTASLTMCYYLRKSKHVNFPLGVVLGTCFAMCAYGIIQTIDPMWLDGLAFLPLIILGVEYLVDDGRKLNYIIPLALMCVANFYIAFMCCIFVAIYYVFYVCFGSDKQEFKAKPLLKTTGRMALASIVALACASFMLLPVANALSMGKLDFTQPDYSFKTQFTPLEFFAQFCVNQYNSVNVQGKPEIYCGVLALLCLPLFFCNGRIPVRKRVGYGFLTVVMFLCMLIRPIDMLWHGGQMPNWLPFRYSFIFSFILLSMTAMTLRYVKNIRKDVLAISFTGIFVLLMIANSRDYKDMKGNIYLDPAKTIWATVILLAVYCGFILLMGLKKDSKLLQRIVSVALTCTVGFELTYNAVLTFKDIDKEVAYSTRKSYEQYVKSGRDLVDKLEAYDEEQGGGFFRAEKTYQRCINDNSGFGLRGITHSSSVMNAKILKFIEAMGYCNRSYSSGYEGNTPLTDSLLGIKYVLDAGAANWNFLKEEENPGSPAAYQKIMEETCKTQSETDMEVNVYQNPNALSMGYMVSDDAQRIAFFGNDNPFNSQNLLLSTITGNTTFDNQNNFSDWHKYFTPLYEDEKDIRMRLNEVGSAPYGDKQTNYYELINGQRYVSQSGQHAADPTVDLFIEAQKEEPIYLFFKTENKSKVNLWLADQWNLTEPVCKNKDGSDARSLGAYLDDDRYFVLNLGTYPKGTQLQVRMTLLTDTAGTKEKYAIIQNFFFYHFDSELFRQDIDTLKDGQWQLTTYGGRELEGTITADSDQIMMTSIPAEDGWEVWVDGKKFEHTYVDADGKEQTANFVTLYDALIGVKLEPGEHTVRMKYTPPHLRLGLVLLVIGLGFIVMFFIYDRKHNAVLALIRKNKAQGIYELPYEDDPDPASLIGRRGRKQANKEAEQTAQREIQDLKQNLVADELKKLDDLRKEGILTQEEFDAQKKKLLNK